MLAQYIANYNDEVKVYGDKPRIGANEDQIQNLISNVKKELDFNLPEDYLSFLRITNGFNYNGRFIYCIDHTSFYSNGKEMPGIIQRTVFWRENDDEFKKWVFFGNDDTSLYVFDGDTNEYKEYDVSGDVWGTFSSFTEMAEKILRDALGLNN